MSITETASGSSIGHRIDSAVVRSSRLSRSGILEHTFSAAFRGLVYPQIWEDPIVDMAALALKPTDDVIAIASGSCNVMSYLTVEPASITAVDLSPAHVALGRLKIAAARHLPDQKSFENFFRHGNLKSNTRLYERYLRDRLDATTRAYWATLARPPTRRSFADLLSSFEQLRSRDRFGADATPWTSISETSGWVTTGPVSNEPSRKET